jgi:hypothetical protein
MSESSTAMQEPSKALHVSSLPNSVEEDKEGEDPGVVTGEGEGVSAGTILTPAPKAISTTTSNTVKPPPAAAPAPAIEELADLSATDASLSDDPSNNNNSGIRPPRGVGKRPLLTHNKDGKMLSEKKLRRLEKNRLSARECRRRKREATENLQREINVLEAENLRLRLQLQIGDEAEENMKKEQAKLTEDIDALLKSGAPESEVLAALESFKEKHADYGRDRRSAIEFHLRNIERLLMPTQTTSIVMKAIQGVHHHPPEDQTGKSDTVATPAVTTTTTTPTNPNFDPKALFQYLVQHLDVTPEQAAALKDSRLVAKEMDDCLAQALTVLQELRQRMTQTGQDLEQEFDTVRSILTPTQAAKFLVWVANNGAAIHMLNELWDRVYPASAAATTTAVTVTAATTTSPGSKTDSLDSSPTGSW